MYGSRKAITQINIDTYDILTMTEPWIFPQSLQVVYWVYSSFLTILSSLDVSMQK